MSSKKAKVKKSKNGCLEWQGAFFYPEKYGKISFRINGKKIYRKAHRMAWEEKYGAIKDGLCVLHKCDNPSCVNTKHLFLGTRAENNKDRDNKGRTNKPVGARNHQAKITKATVLKIRNAHGTQNEISKKYKISKSQVGRIIRNESWKV